MKTTTSHIHHIAAVAVVLPFAPAEACCDITEQDLAEFAARNSKFHGVNRIAGHLEQVPTDTLPESEHPDVVDMIMNRYGEGVLASTVELELVGIDTAVLQRAIETGMNPHDFQAALDAGLIDVDEFNYQPYTRTVENRADYNDGISHLADMAREGRSSTQRYLAACLN